MKQIKKDIIPLDDNDIYGTILYGYTNLKEAKKDYFNLTGEILDIDNVQKVRVEKFKNEDGENCYYWGKRCKECGKINTGVWSFIELV